MQSTSSILAWFAESGKEGELCVESSIWCAKSGKEGQNYVERSIFASNESLLSQKNLSYDTIQ